MPSAPIITNTEGGSKRSVSTDLNRGQHFVLMSVTDAAARLPVTMQFSRREWAEFLNAGQDLLPLMPIEREV